MEGLEDMEKSRRKLDPEILPLTLFVVSADMNPDLVRRNPDIQLEFRLSQMK